MAMLRSALHGGFPLPPRRTTLKKSLRAIERAFANTEQLFAGITDRVRAAECGAGRTPLRH